MGAKTCVLDFVMTLIRGQVMMVDGVRFPRSGHTRPSVRAGAFGFYLGMVVQCGTRPAEPQ